MERNNEENKNRWVREKSGATDSRAVVVIDDDLAAWYTSDTE